MGSEAPGQQLVWISVAVIKTAWLVLSIHGSQPALCSFSGCPPCTARHLLVLQSKSWLCRGNGVWTSAFLTDKLPRDQSWSQQSASLSVGCGMWGHRAPILLPLPTKLQQSCLQATQAGQGESLPCRGALVPHIPHIAGWRHHQAPALLTLSYSPGSKAS